MMTRSLPLLRALTYLIVAGGTNVARAQSDADVSTGEWQLLFRLLDGSLAFWFRAAACGLAAITTVWLFRYEQRLVSRSLGVLLLTLRLLLIGLLFLLLLEPVWSWQHDQQTRGRVLLAVDVSESMETHDRQATPEEKLRWGLGLGLIRDPEARARSEALLTTNHDQQPGAANHFPETLTVLLSELDQFSRIELARRVLTRPAEGIIAQLSPLTNLNAAILAENWREIPLNELDRLGTPDELDLDRTRTRLEITASAAGAGSGIHPLVGIVLLTDGRETGRLGNEGVIASLQQLDVPVYPVLLGSQHRPRDLSLLHVEGADTVFVNDRPQLKVLIDNAGFEGQSLTVTIADLEAPGTVLDSKEFTPTDPTSEIQLSLPPAPLGRHRYQLEILPREGETRTDNNTEPFVLNVVDDRARVLLIDQTPRWEYRYLDAMLSRDPRILLDKVLFSPPWMGLLPQPFVRTRLPDATEHDTPFATYDLVILGDVSPADFTPEDCLRLGEYVRDEGGTLVISSGPEHMPREFMVTPLAELLPVDDIRPAVIPELEPPVPPPLRGAHLQVTPDGERFPMFQLGETPAESQNLLSLLSGHPWGLIAAARGGASVWATLTGARPLSLEEERRQGVIVHQFVGSGQVVWLGIDSTWRWRYLVGELYHQKFWGQLVRWAVSFKSQSGNDNVQLALRESLIKEGETALLQARWDKGFLARHPQVHARALIENIHPGASITRTLPLAPQQPGAALWEARVTTLPPGEYRIRLQVDGADPGREIPELLLVVNPRLDPELANPSADPQFLARLAAATGGELITLDQLSRLAGFFAETTVTTSTHHDLPLWNHWSMLLLFCGIAMTEWVTRKLNGLP